MIVRNFLRGKAFEMNLYSDGQPEEILPVVSGVRRQLLIMLFTPASHVHPSNQHLLSGTIHSCHCISGSPYIRLFFFRHHVLAPDDNLGTPHAPERKNVAATPLMHGRSCSMKPPSAARLTTNRPNASLDFLDPDCDDGFGWGLKWIGTDPGIARLQRHSPAPPGSHSLERDV